MNKKKVKISHWKTQLDTTKDTLIQINIQKTKQTKNIRTTHYSRKRKIFVISLKNSKGYPDSPTILQF